MIGGFPGAVRSGGIRQSFTGAETTLSSSIMARGTKATEWETKQMLWLSATANKITMMMWTRIDVIYTLFPWTNLPPHFLGQGAAAMIDSAAWI